MKNMEYIVSNWISYIEYRIPNQFRLMELNGIEVLNMWNRMAALRNVGAQTMAKEIDRGFSLICGPRKRNQLPFCDFVSNEINGCPWLLLIIIDSFSPYDEGLFPSCFYLPLLAQKLQLRGECTEQSYLKQWHCGCSKVCQFIHERVFTLYWLRD